MNEGGGSSSKPGPGPETGSTNTWALITDMLADGTYLTRHQIESVNEFYKVHIARILAHYSRSGQSVAAVRFDESIMHAHPSMMGHRRRLSLRLDNHILGLPTIEETTGHRTDMTPHLARTRNLTYSAPLHVDVHLSFEYINDDGLLDASHRKTIRHVLIGRVPIMVGSLACRLKAYPDAPHPEECRNDLRGYFIVNGQERIVLSADRIADNWPLIFSTSRSSTSGYEADIRSVAYECLVPQKLTLRLDHTKHTKYGRPIVAIMRALRGGKDFPLFVLFRALGVESDADIQRYIVCGDGGTECHPDIERMLMASAEHAAQETKAFTQAAALEWLRNNLNTKHHAKRYSREWVAHPDISAYLLRLTLDEELLPHCGTNANAKALFLGAMTLKLLRVTLKLEPPDNRDTYLNKRVETPGDELKNILRAQVNKLISDCIPRLKKMMEETPPDKLLEGIDQKNINLLLKPSIIEKAMEKALATGNFGSNKMQIMARSMMGMSQLANRMNYLATMSHLRRFMSHIERNGKMVAPRKLDVSHYGIICMSETPEGAQVGIVKNMSVSCYVSLALDPAPALALLAPMVVQHPTRAPGDDAAAWAQAAHGYLRDMSSSTSVYFNGALLGHAPDPRALVEAMRAAKRCGAIPHVTAVVWRPRDRVIKMSLEAGRPTRPLFVVRPDGRLAWTGRPDFEAAVRAGEIEFVDPEETATAMIAMNPADCTGAPGAPPFTHAEIHPCMALGVLANNIPFSNCNQSPRNVYQCLAGDEPVLLAHRAGMRCIKHLKVGDEVATFDPETRALGHTRVVDTLASAPTVPMVELKTRGGRAIKVTRDHRFMACMVASWRTDPPFVGWMEAAEIDAGLKGGYAVGVATFEPATTAYDAYLGHAAGLRDASGGKDHAHLADGADAADHALARDAKRPDEVAAPGFFVGYLASQAHALDPERAEALANARLGSVDPATGELCVPHTAKERLLTSGGVPFARARHAALRREVEGLRGEDVVLSDGDALFLAVEAVEPAPSEAAVYDITVDGPAPCFVAGRSPNPASLGGFGVHNSAMGKQAMGMYATSFNHRLDGTAHLLHATQRPIVGTKMASLLRVDEMTNGVNVVVLIGSMSHNQEDAVIINEAAMQRGLFVSSYWRTFRDRILKNFATGEEETLTGEKPDARNALKHNYGKLSETGLPPVGTPMVPGDVLIGKVMKNKAGRPAEDNSYVLQKNDGGVVSQVHHNPLEVDFEGYKFIKIQLLNVREPEVGDKFSSRHGCVGHVGKA